MKRFLLSRMIDETGVSGTGIVAEGVLFENGKVALGWKTEHTSVAVYDNMETVEAVHGHGGLTVVLWVDWPKESYKGLTGPYGRKSYGPA